MARVFGESVHFRDGRGGWRAIDSRLQRRDGRLVQRANRFGVSLPLALGEDSVRVRKGRAAVSFRLRGARGAARVRGADAVYRDALPGVDVVYGTRADGLKEELVLRRAGTRTRFVFDLGLSRGLRARLLRSKALAFVDGQGRARLSVPAPFMVDARGRRSGAVRFDVARVDGRWRLTLVADGRWLSRAGRAWPVTVDPWVRVATDGDCTLDSAAPESSSLCAANELRVANVGGGEQRALLRFDLDGVMARPVDIEHTMLKLPVKARGATSPRLGAYPLRERFTGAASWNRPNGTERWADAGGEVDERDHWSAGWVTATAGGTHVVNVRKAVQEWVADKRSNHGVALKVIEGSGEVTFNSSELSSAAPSPGHDGEPYIDIRYQPRVGEKRAWKFESWQLSDRIAMKVNAATGNLLVRQTDFSMPGGLGPGVTVARSYNSQDRDERAFGRGWGLDGGHDEHVFAWGNEFATWRAPSGAQFTFDGTPDQAGSFITPPGLDMTLRRDDDAAATKRFVLTEHGSQLKRFFDGDGRLTAYEDRNGRATSVAYSSTSADAAVASVADGQGDQVTFQSTSSKRMTSFSDPAGRTSSFAYNADGKLASFADAENGTANRTLYEYGECNQLTKLTTPGGRVTVVDYFDEGHAEACKVRTVTRVTNAAAMTGPTWTFEYRLAPTGKGETRVTDPIGTQSPDDNDRVTRYEFDDQSRVTKATDALRRETQTKLTSTSKVQSYTAAGNTGTTPNTSFTFDSATDNLTGTSTPTTAQGGDAMTTSNAYGGSGVNAGTPGSQYLPTQGVNEQGGVTKTAYTAPGDLNGNPSSVGRYTAADTLVSGTTMDYEPAASALDGKPGQLKAIRDGRTNTTTYGYDAKGNVASVTPPAPLGPTRMTYHPGLARVEKVQDGKDNWRLMSYDQLDRLTRIAFTGADQTLASTEPYVAYTYDRDGNQLTEESREQGTATIRTRTMTYDAQNRVTYEALPGGQSNTMAYDDVGNLTALTDAGGKVEYAYDAANQIRAVYEPGTSSPTKFEHNKDGQRTKTSYPNGVSVDWGYDQAQRLTAITAKNASSTVLQDLAYKYRDPSTQRQTPLRFEAEDEVLARRTRYGYDGLDRLRSAVAKTNAGTDTDAGWSAHTSVLASWGYDLDAAGNVTQKTVGGSQLPASTTSYAYNAANQLCARSTGALPADPCGAGKQSAFDANGNETTSVSGRTAAYNLLDQTTTITPSASTPVGLLYLGAGQDRWTGEGGVGFQHTVLGATSRGTDRFTRDESGKLVSRRNGTSRHYYLHDALGSVYGLTDTTGNVQRYGYDPYGDDLPAGSAFATGLAAAPGGQFGFAGGYRTTAAGLYHYGQRFYDPALMRWTQTDPLDQTGDLREGNRYVYVGGDPVNLTDLEGTHSQTSGDHVVCDSQGCKHRQQRFEDNGAGGGSPTWVQRTAYGCGVGLLGFGAGNAAGMTAKKLVTGTAYRLNPWGALGSCAVGAIRFRGN